MTKTPVVIENFISKDDALRFETFLNSIAEDLEYPKNYRNALGYPNSNYASKVGYSEPVLRGYENSEHQQTVVDLGSLLLSVKKTLEDFFSEEMSTVQFGYSKMLAGAHNGLHSDSTKLDGSPYSDDGTPEELEWSALVYLTSHGEDFEGGEIEFPNQNVIIPPSSGQLVFFKGDVEHLHKVNKVVSGERGCLVFFFGRRGNTSDDPKFIIK